jgi:predicted O-linked N-acetylglucosamine transferase (SPINDLY family)
LLAVSESEIEIDINALLKEAFGHAQAGRHAEAEAALRRILQVHPDHAEALHELGMLQFLRGQREAAVELLQRSVAAAPDVFRSRYNLGLVLLREGRFGDAVPHFQRAVEIAPQRLDALNALGNCYREIGELEDSIRAYRRVLAVEPDNAMAHLNLAVSLQDQGKLTEAIPSYERALELHGGRHPLTHSDLLLCLNYSDVHTAEQVFEAHREFAKVYAPPASPAPPPRPNRKPGKDGRIRIGYLSPDFRGHSVAFFILPVLNHHDRSRFEVTCYSDVATPEPMTEVLKNAPERWRDVAGVSDDRLAQLIREDGIDILVDLAGHTPRNRLPLLARRIAPIQVTYLGYPNTTGLSTIDYRITDAAQDPPGMTESIHSEQLVRLPRAFFTQLTISGMPEVAPLPAMSSAGGGVTFAVFTNFVKVRPAMMKLWARILRQTKNSRLLIQARSLRDRATRDSVARIFADEGIDAGQGGRLELREYVEFPEYIAMYKDVDIVLDTFPFNGHTTTCQALWMGVPVVTLAGNVSRSRMGASVLGTIGLGELVAQSQDEYVRIATELANDLPRLAAMRSTLRQRVAQSPILDCAGFTRALEAAYTEMIGKLATNG